MDRVGPPDPRGALRLPGPMPAPSSLSDNSPCCSPLPPQGALITSHGRKPVVLIPYEPQSRVPCLPRQACRRA